MNKEYKIEQCKDSNRVFISTEKEIVEVHITEDGVSVEITRGNEVIAECGADFV